MPRVYTKTARASKYRRACTGCGETIKPGDSYYTWSRRFGRSGLTYYRHTSCGRPRPTELSSRKTAQIEEAISDTDFSFSEEVPKDGEPGESYDIDLGHLESVLGDIAEVAREVASEYESSADSMPENLQYGYQAEAMREVAGELESWADDLDAGNLDPTVYLPEASDHEDDDGNFDRDAWHDAAQQLVDEKIAELISEAEDMVSDVPEYQG